MILTWNVSEHDSEVGKKNPKKTNKQQQQKLQRVCNRKEDEEEEEVEGSALADIQSSEPVNKFNFRTVLNARIKRDLNGKQ